MYGFQLNIQEDLKGVNYKNKIFSVNLHVDEPCWLGEMDFKLGPLA